MKYIQTEELTPILDIEIPRTQRGHKGRGLSRPEKNQGKRGL